MAPVTLPASFYNSFWSPDYRTGLDVLFKQLDKGCKEAVDLEAFISSQAEGHHTLSRTLFQTPSSPSDSTSSLQHTLLALKSGSSSRGEAHRALALELESRVLIGFAQWKDRHAERVSGAKKDVLGKGGVIALWEKEAKNLASLRQAYTSKTRAADDAEDDARFAPPTASSSEKDMASAGLKSPPVSVLSVGHSPDSSAASPQRKSALLQRSGTVADRISEKLRAASISSPLSPSRGRKPMLSIDGKHLPDPPTPLGSATPADGHRSPTSPSSPREDAFIPPSDPNGKPTFPSGPPVPGKNGELSSNQAGGERKNDGPAILEVQPAPILLSGLSLPVSGLQDLLKRFESYVLFNPAPYADPSVTAGYTKSNAALASRQRSTILGTYEKTFSGEEFTDWLKQNVEGFGGDWERSVDAARELHSMGYIARVGVGRGFEPQDDIYYVLRHDPSTSGPLNAPAAQTAKQYGSQAAAQAAAAFKDLQKQNPISPATSANLQNMIKTYVPARFAPTDEPVHVRMRRDAGVADDKYRDAVRMAEGRRLEMEQMIERGLRVWERWERERLGVFQQVLKQYDEALAKLPARLNTIQKQTQLSIETYNPEADLRSLIEGHRTGPFKPQAQVYESLEVDLPDVNFGIDLRRWAGDHGWKAATTMPRRKKGAVPVVLEGLLNGIANLYEGLEDAEKRKSWIYEVPLPEIHALRNSINHPELESADIVEMCKRFNAPIVAGTVKLWLLELNPPVMGWEGWEDAKAVYPAVGADQEREMKSAVTSVLARLPGAQLFVLDAIVGHLRRLVDSTTTDETNEVFTTKLALSLGRCILRPQAESDLTIGDRTPSLFFADLVALYADILPPLVEKKKTEAERVMPVRKRTQLVDQRPSRRTISEDDTHKTLFERQSHIQKEKEREQRQQQEQQVLDKGKGKQREDVPIDDGNADIAQSASRDAAPQADKGEQIVPKLPEPVEQPTRAPAPPPAAESVVAATPVAPPIPAVQPGVPMMADPKDSDDEDDSFTPPTAHRSDAPPSLPPIAAGQEEENPMADILDSYVGPDDQPIPGASGATGTGTGIGSSALKRATSGDAAGSGSRLRGPRGARGPRPAGGRSLGMTQGEDDGEIGRQSPVGGVRRGHTSKSSVSAMAARFEQK